MFFVESTDWVSNSSDNILNSIIGDIGASGVALVCWGHYRGVSRGLARDTPRCARVNEGWTAGCSIRATC